MEKEKIIRVRIGETEEKTMEKLVDKYLVTKSQIVREGIANYEAVREGQLYPLNVKKILEPFGEKYEIVTCGIVGDDLLLGKGIWVELKADFSLLRKKEIQCGKARLTMEKNIIRIEGGYLDDMKQCLSTLSQEKSKGGAGMAYFSVTDDGDQISTYVLASYKIEKNEENVEISLNSMNDVCVKYRLKPDMRFKTCDQIKKCLEKMFDVVISDGHILKISENFERAYVFIGYETTEEFERAQFTASKM